MFTLIGHTHALDLLQRSLEQGRLAHAYLFLGPRHVGKMALALNLAQALLCVGPGEGPCQTCTPCQRVARGRHTDVMVLEVIRAPREAGPARKEISIDQVRDLQRMAELSPLEGKWRVFIINGAEHLSHEAANSLLKTLEEPPPHVLLLLLAIDERSLLPTILSRCQQLRLNLLPVGLIQQALVERYGVAEEEAERLAHLSGGAIGWAISAAQEPQLVERRSQRLQDLVALAGEPLEERFAMAGRLASAFNRDRDELRENFSLWRGWWRDLLLMKEDAPEQVVNVDRLEEMKEYAQRYTLPQVMGVIKGLDRAWRELEQNINPRLALEVLMLDLPEAPAPASPPPPRT